MRHGPGRARCKVTLRGIAHITIDRPGTAGGGNESIIPGEASHEHVS